MIEYLERPEIPLQVQNGRTEINAVVPVQLGVSALDPTIKQAVTAAQLAEVVVDQYNEDIDWLRSYRRAHSMPEDDLRGFEEFSPEWSITAEPDTAASGFLRLGFREGNNEHIIKHSPIPTIFRNQHFRDSGFLTPDIWKETGYFPLNYREPYGPVIVCISPERLRLIGNEVPELHCVIDEAGGIAEVVGSSFDSEYLDSIAVAIMLRNLGIAYVNQAATIANAA
ncbi:MAG: hypothetical protein QG623_360 [Patescibacteria group bacterium]|nr:hypothetical protein [Patescibacteria group bacterium]